MIQPVLALKKDPPLRPAEDYYRLRREGIGFISELSGALYTDYNTHDPGITILEACCYVCTDLSYRTNWNIEDLLTPATPSKVPNQFYPHQAFFTAREILTTNPVTPDDFRRLLIDLDQVRNAWVMCKQCGCDLRYYAWCENNELQLSFEESSTSTSEPITVEPKGLYEVLLELEADPVLGDLNDRKIEHLFFVPGGKPVTIELRFPDWGLEKRDDYKTFLDRSQTSFKVNLLKFNRNKTDNASLTDTELRNKWRNLFYASFEVELLPGGKIITIPNVSLRFFSDVEAKNSTTVSALEALLKDEGPHGFVARYRQKLFRVQDAIQEAKTSLHEHRNLDEDYCRVGPVQVEDVAVCADVEVAAEADIERVQAEIWFQIERYFNPPVPFHTLDEMMNDGVPVEEIFNGPELQNGFIKSDDLERASLKSALRVSDLINLLMDIQGVIAVNNLQLTKYDSEGNIVKGAADPLLSGSSYIFDPNKTSASWLLSVTNLHQPRFYYHASRFLFFKKGLPFRARLDEAQDTLLQLRGEADRPKNKHAINDLAVPEGVFRSPGEYYPLQYSFPLTYGIGPDGLPPHVSQTRKAQAKQMKAYLMVFEQLFGNAFAQLANASKLFSLDPSVNRTYFVQAFEESTIKGFDEITSGLNPSSLEAMTETDLEFLDRRNRFLNHLMARFGEEFSEYGLLLTKLKGQAKGLRGLIEDKVSFIRAYPKLSHDRARAFNYKKDPSEPGNIAGLKKRIGLLFGYPEMEFSWTVTGSFTVTDYALMDDFGNPKMGGALTMVISDPGSGKAVRQAYRTLLRQMMQPEAYDIVEESPGKFRVKLKDINGDPMGQSSNLYNSQSEAREWKEELLNWSAYERSLLIEHLLLRPKFHGDALFPACVEGTCETCGNEDPYSFRLTFMIPGWISPFNTDLQMRDFANRTIREETPSHLLGKICWVGNDGFTEDPCSPVVGEVADLLDSKGATSTNASPTSSESCACALALFHAFSKVFIAWYQDKILNYFSPSVLQTALEAEFGSKVNFNDVPCAVVITPALAKEITASMVKYFQGIALNGWQFDRFEKAWHEWAEANAKIDWTEELLLERLTAILGAQLVSPLLVSTGDSNPLCLCAEQILKSYGTAFSDWLNTNLKAGNSFEALPAFVAPSVVLCAGFNFKAGTGAVVEAFLLERYAAYTEVSYRLRVVVQLLARLKNTYPEATLHDCDDGSDQNPVRLDYTALGNIQI